MHGDIKLTQWKQPTQIPHTEVMEELKNINLDLRAVCERIGTLRTMQSTMRKVKPEGWDALYSHLIDEAIKLVENTYDFALCEHHYNERDWDEKKV